MESTRTMRLHNPLKITVIDNNKVLSFRHCTTCNASCTNSSMPSWTKKQDQKTGIVATKSKSKSKPFEKPWSVLGKRKIAGEVHDGGINPTLKLSGEVLKMIFHIHHFASRKEKSGEKIRTDPVKAHGHEWILTIYPRGLEESPKLEFVGVYLGLKRPNGGGYVSVRANVAFHIGLYHKSLVDTFTASSSKGFDKAILRSNVINNFPGEFLDKNGTMVVEVEIDIFTTKRKVWYPKLCPLTSDSDTLPKMYRHDEEKDAKFVVKGKEFLVHKCLLAVRAPVLYDLDKEKAAAGAAAAAAGATSSTDDPVEITDIDEFTFGNIVKYMYKVLTVGTLTGSLQVSKDLYLAADRFGLTSLKIYIESVMIDKHLNPSTAAMLLHLADSHSSPLLKEHAMSICVENMEDVQKTDDWSLVMESTKLLSDILAVKVVSNRNGTSDSTSSGTDRFEEKSVAELRKDVEEAGLDLDGDKDMLVRRLRKWCGLDYDDSDDESHSDSDDSGLGDY